MLTGTKETFIRVDYNDVDSAITEFFGLTSPYEFVAMQECGNDSEHSYAVQIGHAKSDWANKSAITEGLALMESKNPRHFSTGYYLNYMCLKGAIEPGTYLVTVCW